MPSTGGGITNGSGAEYQEVAGILQLFDMTLHRADVYVGEFGNAQLRRPHLLGGVVGILQELLECHQRGAGDGRVGADPFQEAAASGRAGKPAREALAFSALGTVQFRGFICGHSRTPREEPDLSTAPRRRNGACNKAHGAL